MSTQLNVKTVLFQVVQFSISTQFSSIWPINRTLSGVTTPGQSGPGSDGNKGVLRIPQSSRFTETSPSGCLVSYPRHSLGSGLTPLQRSSQCILQPPANWAIWYRVTSVGYIMKITYFCNDNLYVDLLTTASQDGYII